MLAVEPGLPAVARLLVARLKQHYSFVPLHQAIIIDLVMRLEGDLVVVGLSQRTVHFLLLLEVHEELKAQVRTLQVHRQNIQMCNHHFVIPKQQAIILPAFSPLPPVLAYFPLVQLLPQLTPSVPALQAPVVIPLLLIHVIDLAIQRAPQQLH